MRITSRTSWTRCKIKTQMKTWFRALGSSPSLWTSNSFFYRQYRPKSIRTQIQTCQNLQQHYQIQTDGLVGNGVTLETAWLWKVKWWHFYSERLINRRFSIRIPCYRLPTQTPWSSSKISSGLLKITSSHKSSQITKTRGSQTKIGSTKTEVEMWIW